MYIFAIWMILLLLGTPVFISLGLASVIYLLLNEMPLYIVAQRMFGALDSFILLAVPFYVMAGEIMNVGGVTSRLFRFVESVLGFVPGALGHVNIVANMIMSGMSGSAVADIGGLGKIEINAMTKRNNRLVTPPTFMISPAMT